MAKGKTPIVFENCGGGGCAINTKLDRYQTSFYPGFSYTTGRSVKVDKKGRTKVQQTPPCATSRETCPVQLIFDEGTPKLRFCKKAGNKKPGYTVRVSNAEEAQKIAESACACWKRNKKNFTKCFPSDTALGRARR